jgi:hypothetical protein
MAMPAPSKTWYGLVNKVLANNSTAANCANSYLHALLKTLLGSTTGYTAGTTGAPPASSNWTCELSSTGAVAGAGDNFSTAYVAGEWLSNTPGSAHSWFVLKSPASAGILDGPWYMLWSKDSATATTWRVSLSKTAFAAGTTTADPTNGGVVSTTGTVIAFHASSTTAGKTHFLVDAKGNFWFFVSRDGGQVLETWDSLNELTETQPSGDAHRVIGYRQHIAAGIFSSSATGTLILGTPILGFQRTGLAQVSNQMIISGADISGLNELNGINSEVEGVKYGLVYSITPGSMLIRGYIPDLYQISTAPSNGSNSPDAVSPIWTAMGATLTGGKVALPLPNVLSL